MRPISILGCYNAPIQIFEYLVFEYLIIIIIYLLGLVLLSSLRMLFEYTVNYSIKGG